MNDGYTMIILVEFSKIFNEEPKDLKSYLTGSLYSPEGNDIFPRLFKSKIKFQGI